MDANNTYDSAAPDDSAASTLGRLSELDDFQVADGYPDIRGWDVKTTDGQNIGKVSDLIVDAGAMRVRYLDVEVDKSVAAMADSSVPGKDEQHTLLPIGKVELDEDNDEVLVDGFTLQQVAGMPRYAGGSVTRDYEKSLRNSGEPVKANADSYDHADYDDQRLYGSRRQSSSNDAEQRITLAEEQLSVGKRQVSGGEVQLRKTVDTEHVQQSVPVMHEEVVVERRPIRADAPMQDTEIGEDEIRLTIMEEQVVVEKRMVPREEIIVRKKQVTEQQTVGADVRRERLVTEGLNDGHGQIRDSDSGN